MSTRIKARYANGVLTPLDPLELDEGCEVSLEVSVEEDLPQRTFGDFLSWLKRQHDALPEDAWDDLPTDLAKNKKHYLYGHPKEEDE